MKTLHYIVLYILLSFAMTFILIIPHVLYIITDQAGFNYHGLGVLIVTVACSITAIKILTYLKIPMS